MRIKVSLGVLAFLLLPGTAFAREDFPLVMQIHLNVQTPPPCSVCHLKGNTGGGTPFTAFGWAMRGEGMNVEEPDSVGRALDALRAKKIDSDGDGTSDVDELVRGTDPNTPAAVTVKNGEEPGYGCGGKAPDPNHPGDDAILVPFALAGGAAALRRRRR